MSEAMKAGLRDDGLPERVLAFITKHGGWTGALAYVEQLESANEVLSTPHAEGTVPVVQATAPERIWLTVSEDDYDAEQPFPGDEAWGEVCWSVDAPVAVCVPYVRADRAASIPSEPANAVPPTPAEVK